MNLEVYVCQFCSKKIKWDADTGEYIGDCRCREETKENIKQ